MSETTRRKLTPKERLIKRLQTVERGLEALGRVQGEFEPMVIEAARERLARKVTEETGRIRKTTQLVMFQDLERRAEELRSYNQVPSLEPDTDLIIGV